MDYSSLVNENILPWPVYPNTAGRSHNYLKMGLEFTGKPNLTSLNHIEYQGVQLDLITPIHFMIQRDADYHTIDYPEADIHISVPTRDEAIRAFHEEFVFLWHQYAEADDTELTKDAIILKKWLLKKAKAVQVG